MWTRLKIFFASLWAKIKGAGKWLVAGLLGLVLIIGGVYALTQDNDKKSDSSNQPEVAQVYEPSIGTPLPPDNNGSTTIESSESGQVAGDSTTDVSATVSDGSNTNSTTSFTAPSAGIDPSQPIKYENSNLVFRATLPAGTKVTEHTNNVTFYSASGELLYNVDVMISSDSLETISAQLKASTDVNNISKTTFAGLNALQFNSNGLNGYVVVKNNRAYYFIGHSNQLRNITI